jgi:hypothetical protein
MSVGHKDRHQLASYGWRSGRRWRRIGFGSHSLFSELVSLSLLTPGVGESGELFNCSGIGKLFFCATRSKLVEVCHCERSEAILVLVEIASSLALLAMTGVLYLNTIAYRS